MTIYSCKDCVAPKRHPGCHSQCQEYLAQKAAYDAMKAEYDKKQAIERGIYVQRSNRVYQAMKGRRRG
jgi:hypothetical protein